MQKRFGFILVSGILLQACVSSNHGIVGNLVEMSGTQYEVGEDAFFVVREKTDKYDAIVVAIPAGTYVLEAIDDQHAYFVAPKYTVFYELGGLANVFESGEAILYEDMYQSRLTSDDWDLFKPGCRPGGIKVPFVDTPAAKYQMYSYHCPRGTWNVEGVDESRIADGGEKGSVTKSTDPSIILAATVMNKSERGKLVQAWSFEEGSAGYSFLSGYIPPLSRSDVSKANASAAGEATEK